MGHINIGTDCARSQVIARVGLVVAAGWVCGERAHKHRVHEVYAGANYQEYVQEEYAAQQTDYEVLVAVGIAGGF